MPPSLGDFSLLIPCPGKSVDLYPDLPTEGVPSPDPGQVTGSSKMHVTFSVQVTAPAAEVPTGGGRGR